MKCLVINPSFNSISSRYDGYDKSEFVHDGGDHFNISVVVYIL